MYTQRARRNSLNRPVRTTVYLPEEVVNAARAANLNLSDELRERIKDRLYKTFYDEAAISAMEARLSAAKAHREHVRKVAEAVEVLNTKFSDLARQAWIALGENPYLHQLQPAYNTYAARCYEQFNAMAAALEGTNAHEKIEGMIAAHWNKTREIAERGGLK